MRIFTIGKVKMLIYCLYISCHIAKDPDQYIWVIYTIKMFVLRLRRTINKLELTTKSSEYFYSHQFMKFHE